MHLLQSYILRSLPVAVIRILYLLFQYFCYHILYCFSSPCTPDYCTVRVRTNGQLLYLVIIFRYFVFPSPPPHPLNKPRCLGIACSQCFARLLSRSRRFTRGPGESTVRIHACNGRTAYTPNGRSYAARLHDDTLAVHGLRRRATGRVISGIDIIHYITPSPRSRAAAAAPPTVRHRFGGGGGEDITRYRARRPLFLCGLAAMHVVVANVPR